LRVISIKILREFWEIHSECQQQLKSWFQETSKAEWKNPNEIKLEYPSASLLGNNRVVFNIKGNHYRIIVKINFDYDLSALIKDLKTADGYLDYETNVLVNIKRQLYNRIAIHTIDSYLKQLKKYFEDKSVINKGNKNSVNY